MTKQKIFLVPALLLGALCFGFLSVPESLNVLLKNQPEKEILSNGLTFIYHKDDLSPTSFVHILMKGGKRLEPEEKEGVAFLTTRLCLELPSQQVLQRLMNQATHTSFYCKHDFSVIKISCLSENLEEAIQLSTQILKEPLFSGIRIGRIKENMEHYKKLEEDQPLNVAHSAALDIFFHKTPYARQTYGTKETLKKIKKQDIERHYKESVKAKNMIVSISTNLEKEKTLGIVQQHFEDFSEDEPNESAAISLSPKQEKTLNLEKDTQQTLVYAAFPLPKISERDLVLATMLQNLLGKGVNSKLWSLRTEKKLAYIVGARVFLMKEGGMLEAFLETDQTKKNMAITELQEAIQDLYQNGISPEDLSITKIHSKGEAIRENETKDTKAFNLATMEALELGYDFLNRMLIEIDLTTLEEFNAYIRNVLNPENAVMITVGPTQWP
ncbi:MAG: insulinase family protein [Candidatus Aminicenantes bacterium]|nr:MAG: insulinase family protein [Candidatus Aminicenantes bacterium]